MITTLPDLCARLGLPASTDVAAIARHLLGDEDVELIAMVEVCIEGVLAADAVDVERWTYWSVTLADVVPAITELNRRGVIRGCVLVCMLDDGEAVEER